MLQELYEALLDAPGGHWLETGRTLIRVTGGDRVRFLDGMLTCHVAALDAGQVAPALQLDRRGHVAALVDVLASAEELWLDAAPGCGQTLLEMLERHVIADDVNLEPVADRGWLALEGPGAASAAEALGGVRPESGRFESRDEVFWLSGGRFDPAGVRAIGPAARIAELAARCGLPRIEADTAEILRIEAAEPLLGTDTGPRSFPQEARLDHAVSYEKGCFIGQEIVARIRSRGAVNRLLVQLALEAPVSAGDAVRVGGKSSGEVTSAAVSPLRGPLALAYLRREHADAGTAVEVGETRGSVTG